VPYGPDLIWAPLSRAPAAPKAEAFNDALGGFLSSARTYEMNITVSVSRSPSAGNRPSRLNMLVEDGEPYGAAFKKEVTQTASRNFIRRSFPHHERRFKTRAREEYRKSKTNGQAHNEDSELGLGRDLIIRGPKRETSPKKKKKHSAK